jgi:adenylate cyclase
MAKEIERKFLLADDAWRSLVVRRRDMRQGYLANTDRTSVRVRISDAQAWLNIKSGALAAVRDEFEYEIPSGDARLLLDTVAQKPIVEKTRHWVPFDGFEWEIDEFHGRNEGLIVAEIELDFEEQSFSRPAWIGREVTDQPRYYNVNLVHRPYSTWDEQERWT